MRILIACLIAVMVVVSAINSPAAEPRLIKVGAFNFFPGIFKDSDGQIKGFYVDALAEIAKRENIRFEYIYGTLSEGLERVRSGEVDLLSSVAHTPERASYLDFGRTPLLAVWGELYVPLTSEIDGIREIQGRKVGLVNDDFNARQFMDLVKRFHITCEFVELADADEVFKEVASRKIDAGVVKSTFGVAKQKEYGLRSTGIVFDPFDIYFVTARGKGGNLLPLLDNYLETWRHQPDSPYNLARQKWSHGTVTTTNIVPRWLLNAFVALAVLVVASVAFIVILRKQVRKATADIQRNRDTIIASEAKFRSYIDNSPDGVFVADENGRYIGVNPAASAITGFSQEELLEKHIPDLIPPDSAETALSHFRTLKDSGVSKGEFEFVHKSGTKRWWSVDAVKLSDTRFLGFVKDITDRKRIEETQLFLLRCGAASPAKNFFEALARHLSTTLEMEFVCIDRLLGDGLVARTLAVYSDGKFEDNVEYALKDTPCGDVVGKPICLFQQGVRHKFPQDTVLQDLMAESYVGTTLWSFDGKPIGLIAVIGRRPLSDPALAEAVLKIVGIRSASELERTTAEENLRQINNELESFTYTVSHDLKSPLITIQSFAGQIRHDMENGITNRIPGDLKRIEQAAVNMSALLDDLLELSRVGRVMNPVALTDMNALIRDVLVQLTGLSTQRNIEIITEPDIPHLVCDQSRIRVVVQNLVENAIKYMGEQPAPRIDIGARRDENDVIIQVRDNGKGIDPSCHETVFGLFSKLDMASEGTGIGLALVRRIAEVHGGRAWVESAGLGKGSTFCFALAQPHGLTCERNQQ